jgi:exodeoxyribonuclease VII large subunit
VSFKSAAALAVEGRVPEGPDVLTVTELCGRLRALVRDQPQPVFVRGEVRDLIRAPSGHAYFTIRDEGAQLACVLFRGDAEALAASLQDGRSVIVRADLDFYPGRGQAQLLVRAVRPRGLGDRWVVFEATREALAREGLLDAARKRRPPRFPCRIGVVTSEAGAALRDVLQVLRRRYPLAEVILAPGIVQGEAAPASLVDALARLNARDDVDVILLVRGGGSAEDLWAFNNERLARAIVASRVPVIAAVGHETDVTIAGMAADLRAPTPSAAAELAVPDAAALLSSVEAFGGDLCREVLRRLRDAQQRADGLGGALTPQILAARLEGVRHRWAATRTGLDGARRGLQVRRQTLVAILGRLEALSPRTTLRRGFAIALKGERVVATVVGLAAGDPLLLMLQDGDVECRVVRTRPR